jgi:hypothetical protein
MPTKPYTGSCHCRLITFAVHLDLSTAKTSKCNCSICFKTRAWEITVSPSAFFLNPSEPSVSEDNSSEQPTQEHGASGDKGSEANSESNLTDYTFNSHQVHHLFCKVCGVRPFGRGYWTHGGLGEFVSVNVACLEGVEDEVLRELAAEGKVVYRDGRKGRWGERPEVVEYL